MSGKRARLPKATRRRNKPFVEMDRHEFEATFDELGMQNNFDILEAARKGGEPCVVAVATLRGPNIDGGVVVLRDLENGDGVGIEYIDGFIAEIERVGLLLPGETLTRKVLTVTAADETPFDQVAELEAIIARRNQKA